LSAKKTEKLISKIKLLNKQKKQARTDFNRGRGEVKANEPQGYDLMNKSQIKYTNASIQQKKAAKELIDSDDLKLFKEFEVMPTKNRLGAYYDLGAAKFGGVKMRVPKDTPYAIRRNNLKTGKPYTAKEIDDIAYGAGAERLSDLFETLEKGGNNARKVIKQHPEVAALYKKSGREIPTAALRPDQLKEYIKGKAKGL